VSRAHRIVLVLGVAVAVYGLSSLTGMWLGEPPWWTADLGAKRIGADGRGTYHLQVPHPRRKEASAAVVVLGLAMITFAAWPRSAGALAGPVASRPADPEGPGKST
jgi:hypothetical protein